MIRLRSLLLRWVLLPTLALWAVGFGAAYLHSLAQAHEAYDRSLLGSALVLGESLQLADGQVVADLPFAALEMLRTDAQDRIYYRVADRDAGPGANPHVTGYEDLPAPPAWPAEGADVGQAPLFYDATYKGLAVRIVAVQQVVLDGSQRRRLLVQVAETLEARHQLTRRVVLQSAVVQLLLIALAAGLIAFGVRKGLAPLKHLRDEVRRRGSNDLTPIDTRTVPREVAPLIQAINAHTERQRQLGDAQLRFVANASHQLKTPLTLLRAQVGQALVQTDVEAMRSIVARLDQATAATGHLVGQLLSLARSEPGGLLDEQQLDLTELAQEATFELVAAARSKGIDLGFESDGPLRLRGERVLLRELVTNLVHNAVTYTPPGGRVTVSVRLQESCPLLRVADDGPGIPAAERARAFERFQRLGGSGVPGSGLGLAIVREICARHGAEVTLSDPAGGGPGLWVDVRWPASAGNAAQRAPAASAA